MEPYQVKYLSNLREIGTLADLYRSNADGFDLWFRDRLSSDRRMEALREENLSLLSQHLFPTLDQIFSADSETLRQLEAFSDQLMDWKTNLDCGLYVVIHKALLSLHRVRRSRDGIIRELYRLGMGYYYLYMYVSAIPGEEVSALNFRNEMLFTEAASYFPFFHRIQSEETRGYIIRAMANIALCTQDKHRKIATGIRILQIVQDPDFRAAAPSLPWDVFLSRTHQQMSANRHELSTGDLNRDELAAVLDSCYVVFQAQEKEAQPSVRWLWPLYDMEYSCGYATAEQTVHRLEKLIADTPEDAFDMSGLYGQIQLPLYYSHMLRNHPRLADDPLRLRFMVQASEKMLRALTSCPPEQFDAYFFFLIREVVKEYVEFPGCVTYQDLTRRLLQRFAVPLYIRSRKASRMMRLLSQELLSHFPDAFDGLPFLREIQDPALREASLLDYAESCGLYYDFGLLKINLTRTLQARSLFEDELPIYHLHCLSGWEDLRSRPSTERYADVALGHHAWYNGADGYPQAYQRAQSPYRQMTDVAALISFLLETPDAPMASLVRQVSALEGTRFSPRVTAVFSAPDVAAKLDALLKEDERADYQLIWQELASRRDKC